MDFGIFVLVAVFMIIRIALTNEKKRKKETEQRARRVQHAYSAADASAVHESTPIESESYERARSSHQAYDEGNSAWEGEPSGSLPPRSDEERKRREAAALAAQRAEALRRERMERIARNKTKGQRGEYASDEYASSEGTSAYGQEGFSVEGSSINTNLRRHKLEASSLTDHAHTESSMGSQEDNCDDYAIRGDALGQQSSSVSAMLRGLSFRNEDIVKGFIFGEILSKPKSLRR